MLFVPPAAMRLLLLANILAARAADLLPDFHFSGAEKDHFQLGLAIGRQYHEAIKARVAAHVPQLEQLLNHQQCQEQFQQLLASHQQQVPHLLEELHGISSGSEVKFDQLFAISLQEELGYCNASALRRKSPDHCSDYMLCNSHRCFDVHNEDGDLPDRQLFTARVQLGDFTFTAVNYAGDLLGGMSALAFNSNGLAFSLNWVGPGSCDSTGLGRNFVSRELLMAKGWDEAKAIISQKHAAGHNYQLMDFAQRRISNFEVAHDQVSEKTIDEAFFHANQYQSLKVPGQITGNSSLHRLARVQQLPTPSTSKDALKILGDQEDHAYPIFHDELSHRLGDQSDWTLASVLFDLDEGRVDLMKGNPKDGVVQRSFQVIHYAQRIVV